MTREEIIKEIKAHLDETYNIGFHEDAWEIILEALEQEPKTGHWNSIPKYPDIAWCCSECKHFTTMKHRYCPNCSCRMEK